MDVYLSCMLRVYGCVFCSIFLLFVYLLMPMSSNPSPVIRWGLRNSKKKESGADQLVDHTTDLPKAKSNQCNLSQRPGTALRTTLRFTWSALVRQTGQSPKRTVQVGANCWTAVVLNNHNCAHMWPITEEMATEAMPAPPQPIVTAEFLSIAEVLVTAKVLLVTAVPVGQKRRVGSRQGSINRTVLVFLSLFVGWRTCIPNLITGLSGWRTLMTHIRPKKLSQQPRKCRS